MHFIKKKTLRTKFHMICCFQNEKLHKSLEEHLQNRDVRHFLKNNTHCLRYTVSSLKSLSHEMIDRFNKTKYIISDFGVQ